MWTQRHRRHTQHQEMTVRQECYIHKTSTASTHEKMERGKEEILPQSLYKEPTVLTP